MFHLAQLIRCHGRSFLCAMAMSFALITPGLIRAQSFPMDDPLFAPPAPAQRMAAGALADSGFAADRADTRSASNSAPAGADAAILIASSASAQLLMLIGVMILSAGTLAHQLRSRSGIVRHRHWYESINAA